MGPPLKQNKTQDLMVLGNYGRLPESKCGVSRTAGGGGLFFLSAAIRVRLGWMA
jgi:hypothetical protein